MKKNFYLFFGIVLILVSGLAIGCKSKGSRSVAPEVSEGENSQGKSTLEMAKAPPAPQKNPSKSWEVFKAPPLKGPVRALIFVKDQLLAGVEKQGVFYWDSTARTWSAQAGLEGKSVLTFQVCGNNLFAGTEAFGVYQYLPDKKQWSPINQGLFQIKKGPPPKGDMTGEYPPDCSIDDCRYNRDVYGIACDTTHLYAATDRAVYMASLQDKTWKELWGPLSGINTITFFGQDLYIGRDGGADVCGVYKIKSGAEVIKEATQELGCRSIIDLFSDSQHLLASGNSEVWLKEKGQTDWSVTGKDLDYIRLLPCGTGIFSVSSFESNYPEGRTFRFNPKGNHWVKVSDGIPGEDLMSFAASSTQVYAGSETGKVFLQSCN